MSRRAFTLVELLVVIGIMITLMSLIMGGVMLAKRSAMRAKAVSLLGTVASAIDQYRSLNNTYPERMPYDSTRMPAMPSGLSITDGDDVYAKVFAPGGTTASATAIYDPNANNDGWRAINLILVYQLGDLIREQAISGLVSDPWKTPIRYRPSKWYLYAAAPKPRVDCDNPPGADTYQLWSAGPNAKDGTDPGEGDDDIPSWAKLP